MHIIYDCLCTLCMLLLSMHVCCAVVPLVPFEGDEDKNCERRRKRDYRENAEHWNVNLLYSRELDMSQSTLVTVLKNYHKRGTIAARKPKGRPQKLSIRVKRDLGCILTLNRRLSLVGIIE